MTEQPPGSTSEPAGQPLVTPATRTAAAIRDLLASVEAFAWTLARVPLALARARSITTLDDLTTRQLIPDATVFFVLGAILAAFSATAAPEVATLPGLLSHLGTQSLSSYIGGSLVAFVTAYAVVTVASPLLARLTKCATLQARQALLFVAGCSGVILALNPFLHHTALILLFLFRRVPDGLIVFTDRALTTLAYVYVSGCCILFVRAAIGDFRRTTPARHAARRLAIGGVVFLMMTLICASLLLGAGLLDRFDRHLAELEYSTSTFHLGRLIRCTVLEQVDCSFYARTSTTVLVFPNVQVTPIAPDVGIADNPFPASRPIFNAILVRADHTSLSGLSVFEGTQLFELQVPLAAVCALMAYAEKRGPVHSWSSIGPFGFIIKGKVAFTSPSIVLDVSDMYSIRRYGTTPTAEIETTLYGVETSLAADLPALSAKCAATTPSSLAVPP